MFQKCDFLALYVYIVLGTANLAPLKMSLLSKPSFIPTKYNDSTVT